MTTKENLPPLSKMAHKFLNADPSMYGESGTVASAAFRKVFFFFYGTLMDPAMLAMVLDLQDKPLLQPAKIVGFHCKLWGLYPALLEGPPDAEVHGMAYEVQSSEEIKLLENYETRKYRKRGCRINLKDGTKVNGRTFVWASDEKELNEGSFDLKEWQMDSLERELEEDRVEDSSEKR